VEKWNDMAVFQRCKHCGMSWTETGVLAIAILAGKIKRKILQTTQIHKKNSHLSLSGRENFMINKTAFWMFTKNTKNGKDYLIIQSSQYIMVLLIIFIFDDRLHVF
jgi:hypothetical protein